jgi:hypothetical protein
MFASTPVFGLSLRQTSWFMPNGSIQNLFKRNLLTNKKNVWIRPFYLKLNVCPNNFLSNCSFIIFKGYSIYFIGYLKVDPTASAKVWLLMTCQNIAWFRRFFCTVHWAGAPAFASKWINQIFPEVYLLKLVTNSNSGEFRYEIGKISAKICGPALCPIALFFFL